MSSFAPLVEGTFFLGFSVFDSKHMRFSVKNGKSQKKKCPPAPGWCATVLPGSTSQHL